MSEMSSIASPVVVKGLVCAEDNSSVSGASEVSKHAVSCLYVALIWVREVP
jgi:hypothetical protein